MGRGRKRLEGLLDLGKVEKSLNFGLLLHRCVAVSLWIYLGSCGWSDLHHKDPVPSAQKIPQKPEGCVYLSQEEIEKSILREFLNSFAVLKKEVTTCLEKTLHPKDKTQKQIKVVAQQEWHTLESLFYEWLLPVVRHKSLDQAELSALKNFRTALLFGSEALQKERTSQVNHLAHSHVGPSLLLPMLYPSLEPEWKSFLNNFLQLVTFLGLAKRANVWSFFKKGRLIETQEGLLYPTCSAKDIPQFEKDLPRGQNQFFGAELLGSPLLFAACQQQTGLIHDWKAFFDNLSITLQSQDWFLSPVWKHFSFPEDGFTQSLKFRGLNRPLYQFWVRFLFQHAQTNDGLFLVFLKNEKNFFPSPSVVRVSSSSGMVRTFLLMFPQEDLETPTADYRHPHLIERFTNCATPEGCQAYGYSIIALTP